MIKERTRFSSGIDKCMYDDEVVTDFLNRFGKNRCEEKKDFSVNKRSFAIIGDINEYLDKEAQFVRISIVVFSFLKEFYEDDKEMLFRFVGFQHSVAKQKLLAYAIKQSLKRGTPEKMYYDSIERSLKRLDSRLDYLLDYVIPAYIAMTPLDNYIEKIGKEAFYAEILENFPDIQHLEDERYDLGTYKQKVLSAYTDSKDWEEGLAKYRQFLQQKKEKLQQLHDEETLEKKRKRAELAEKKLISDSNHFFHNWELGNNCVKFDRGVRDVSVNLSRFMEENGGKKGKIVFIAKTRAGEKAYPLYYSAEKDGYLAKTISKATIIGEFDKLPDEILKKVESYDLTYVELMLN